MVVHKSLGEVFFAMVPVQNQGIKAKNSPGFWPQRWTFSRGPTRAGPREEKESVQTRQGASRRKPRATGVQREYLERCHKQPSPKAIRQGASRRKPRATGVQREYLERCHKQPSPKASQKRTTAPNPKALWGSLATIIQLANSPTPTLYRNRF
ncbi:MAG: hypothetical protein A2527_04510 [Candidatus Lambdaproteobacteria bacterium RIFOXYD2_FULL_50_16]|uniref:Uncharacterized protein n=1 Tax=Candidatus Lambdaproteobacteria bacterium RIFOXYD2_FULL_50_16 TaxID=1817772 RepID=A0A1F6GDH9_9PROT|nr:MAG: hypothetical protein A2527_04510 [Candidatus Lambdaproteobacteria bacterium RIFOXYD2_FULL_50_16]